MKTDRGKRMVKKALRYIVIFIVMLTLTILIHWIYDHVGSRCLLSFVVVAPIGYRLFIAFATDKDKDKDKQCQK